MTDAYCDFSELPKDECAHCTGATFFKVPDFKPTYIPGAVTVAAHGGECACCGKGYLPGTEIAKIGDDGWAIKAHCAESEAIDFSGF